MKRSRIFAAILAVAAAASLTYAHAAGMFDNLPIVGGSSYSAGLVTVPAGPTALTGTEKIPADTGLSGGAAPQTVSVTPAALGALPWAYESHAPGTATSVTVTNNIGGLFITTTTGAAKTAQTTIQFPSSPIDNQRFTFATNVSMTFVLFSPNTGQTVLTMGNLGFTVSPTTPMGGAGTPIFFLPPGATFVYRLSDTTWRRVS